MMKYTAIILGLFFLLISCMSNDASIRQTEWYASFQNKPLTEKEKDYIKQLESQGYSKIDIQPPTIGVDFSGSSYYSVSLSNSQIRYTGDNADSLKSISHEIALELYKEIIEDSILFDISKIYISLTIKDGLKKGWERKFEDIFLKKELAKELGFKVIKSGSIYDRIKL